MIDDTELDRLEALFRNPPTASGLSEHGLVLVAELRAVRAMLDAGAAAVIKATKFSLGDVGEAKSTGPAVPLETPSEAAPLLSEDPVPEPKPHAAHHAKKGKR